MGGFFQGLFFWGVGGVVVRLLEEHQGGFF